ncbi:hypothetical protein TrCOL_g12184 [Triparma columacea]|uniref:Non-canonical E2 ubiquitin-conjugating enzyme C-terminal domain-containing protein n=1 Tax=Triparma columacea TaxID=722753 RepID=A0A9W7G4H5_9STRA|nr:hypothetical protein TrCOL_g12184 [Triparma columacea]
MSSGDLTYALPLPILKSSTSAATASDLVCSLLSNSVSSLDSVYFGAPSSLRKSDDWAKHTLTVRITLPTEANPELIVTDMGVGMTRSDVINSLCWGTEDDAGGGGFWKAARSGLIEWVKVHTKNEHDEGYQIEWESGQTDYKLRIGGTFQEVIIGGDGGKGGEGKGEGGTTIGISRCTGTRVVFGVDLKEWKREEDGAIQKAVGRIMETNGYSVVFEEGKPSEIEDVDWSHLLEEEDDGELMMDEEEGGEEGGVGETSVEERARYIPFRLSLAERKMLRLVESAMKCATYTDQVDRSFKNESKRMIKQLKGIGGILHGLVTACNYEAGQSIAEGEESFDKFEAFFQNLFEIARRHKIMNPDKMRGEYGMLVMVMMDATKGEIKEELGFDIRKDLVTVYKFLEEHGGTDLLRDKYIEIATQEILAGKKDRGTIQHEIRKKEKAVKYLKEKYSTVQLSEDDIHTCLYSISDNNSFLNSNRLPVDKMIKYLEKYFHPKQMEEGYSLSIVEGEDGARLNHSHEKQYYFALQSLTLWSYILDDMFRLWSLAEKDLLDSSVDYQLKDTGQGFQRVQQSPSVYRAMQAILTKVQSRVGRWIGSKMIHMGDHNVPNALTYVDKYCQVSRILGPVVLCIENLERMCEDDPNLEDFVEGQFGGLETLKKDILYDFFKSAFDGSGGDNYFDAGSCVDGRLTSAWNWCQGLPEKEYYVIFKLTGFLGFDGDFR